MEIDMLIILSILHIAGRGDQRKWVVWEPLLVPFQHSTVTGTDM